MQFVRVTTAAALYVLFATMVPAYAQRDQQDEKGGKPQDHGQPARKQKEQQRAQQPRQQEHGQPARRQEQQRAQQPRQQEHAQPARRQEQQRAQQPQQQQHGQPARRQEQQRAQQSQERQQVQRSQQARQQQQPQRTEQQAVAWQQQRGWQKQGAWQGQRTWQQGRAQRWSSDHRTWEQRGGYGGYYIPQARFNLSFGSQHWFRINSRPIMYMGYPRFQYGGFSFLLVDPWPEYWVDNWYQADEVYIGYDDGYYLYNRSYPSVRLAITVIM